MNADPPVDHPYASAMWLLDRHPQLAELLARVDGAIDVDDDGEPGIALSALAEAVVEYDANRAAWNDYEHRRPAPEDDDAYDAWRAAGPGEGSRAARDLAAMSTTERNRLRLLATFSTVAVPFNVRHLSGFDDEGQVLIRDWCRAVEAC